MQPKVDFKKRFEPDLLGLTLFKVHDQNTHSPITALVHSIDLATF